MSGERKEVILLWKRLKILSSPWDGRSPRLHRVCRVKVLVMKAAARRPCMKMSRRPAVSILSMDTAAFKRH